MFVLCTKTEEAIAYTLQSALQNWQVHFSTLKSPKGIIIFAKWMVWLGSCAICHSEALSFTFKQIWIINDVKGVQLNSFCENILETPLSGIFLQ